MKNNKGSVLVWALVIILIFSVFAAAALSITYSMVQRSFDNNTNRQLYLTARSAVATVSNEMVSSSGTPLINDIVNNKPNVRTTDTTTFFPADKNMGDCIVKAKCNDAGDQIIVTAVASRDGNQQIVSAIIEKGSTDKWIIVMYDSKDIDESR